jgi:hypothetical protein
MYIPIVSTGGGGKSAIIDLNLMYIVVACGCASEYASGVCWRFQSFDAFGRLVRLRYRWRVPADNLQQPLEYIKSYSIAACCYPLTDLIIMLFGSDNACSVPADEEIYPHGGTTRPRSNDVSMAWHNLRHQLRGHHLSGGEPWNSSCNPEQLFYPCAPYYLYIPDRS